MKLLTGARSSCSVFLVYVLYISLGMKSKLAFSECNCSIFWMAWTFSYTYSVYKHRSNITLYFYSFFCYCLLPFCVVFFGMNFECMLLFNFKNITAVCVIIVNSNVDRWNSIIILKLEIPVLKINWICAYQVKFLRFFEIR